MTTEPTYTQASLARMPLKEQKALLLRAKKVFQTTTGQAPLMPDVLYDYLEALIKQADPKWAKTQKVEVPLTKVNKKFHRDPRRKIGSLDKFYPEDSDSLDSWIGGIAAIAEAVVISDKIDGASLIAETDGGVVPVWSRLTTRGSKSVDGFLAHIPTSVLPPPPNKLAGEIRLEAAVPYEIWDAKYREEFADPRVMAAAVFNRQDVHPSILEGDVRLKVLRSWGFGLEDLNMSAAFGVLQQAGFDIVEHWIEDTRNVNVEELSTQLEESRRRSDFNIDGLVVCADLPQEDLPDDYDHSPDWAKAFKVNAQPIEATVDHIEWRLTRTWRIVPRIHLVPVLYDGIVVRHATANNASWVVSRKIEAGAKVMVLRGGEIIPKIVSVVTEVPTILPTAESLGVGAIAWDSNGTDLKVTDPGSKSLGQRAQALHHMLATVGVEHLALAGCTQIAANPEVTPLNLLEILYHPTGQEFLVSCGVSAKIAAKAIASRPASIPLHEVMTGSGLFGAGVGRGQLSKITALTPTAITEREQAFPRYDFSEGQVVAAAGPVAGGKYLLNIEAFWDQTDDLEYLKDVVVLEDNSGPQVATEGPLAGQRVSFTRYRSEEQARAINAAGGQVIDFSVSKTTILLHAPGKTSNSVTAALSKGIRVTTFDNLGI